MAKAKTAAKKSSSKGDGAVIVDFSDIESRGGKKSEGGRKHYPEGDYAVKVKSAAFGKSAERETPRLEVVFEITQGKYKGKTIRDDYYLSASALWRLRQFLEACGVAVPSKKAKVKPETVKGKSCAITLEDDEYEGKIKSKVSDVYSLDDFDAAAEDIDDEDEDEDEDEDDDTDDDDEEDEDAEDDEEMDDLDLDDL